MYLLKPYMEDLVSDLQDLQNLSNYNSSLPVIDEILVQADSIRSLLEADLLRVGGVLGDYPGVVGQQIGSAFHQRYLLGERTR